LYDKNIEKEAQSFIHLYLGIDLSAEEIKKIAAGD
jgi:hypothetical protein